MRIKIKKTGVCYCWRKENCRHNMYLLSIPFIMVLMLAVSRNAYSDDLRIGKTSIKVSTTCSLVLKNNLSVASNALVWNDGSVFFKNNNEATLNINTILNGEGMYHINGSANCIIEGNGAAISSLSLESGYTVFLRNNLSVSKVLTLESGIIDVPDQTELKLLDTSTDAVVYNDTYNNTSFIQGSLVRNTLQGVFYRFPLGTTSDGFHPLMVDEVSSSGYLEVSYNPDFDEKWNAIKTNGITIEEVGGWQITTASKGITYLPSLSLYESGGLMTGQYNVFYTSEPDVSVPRFSLDYNSAISNNGAYLTTGTLYKSGLLAISKIQFTEHKNTYIPELVNFLVPNGTGRSTFEIPGIENYKNIALSVYNRVGSLVYESSNYANDFDSRDNRPGTYFYELTLITKEGRKILKRDIIEIMKRD